NGNAVEICNSSGTAYLNVATCAVACSSGLCTGMCTAGQRRCNGMRVETCDTAGTTWMTTDTCTTACVAPGQCSLARLEGTTTQKMDGDVVVDGPVIVRTGGTLNSPTGRLTIRAASITVEAGGSISVAATGDGADGRGAQGVYTGSPCYGYSGGGGGGNGTA